MHKFRSHNCAELNIAHDGVLVKLSGWVHKKRDHGSLLFLDLRDHFGITQCVVDSGNSVFQKVDDVKLESVVTISGYVRKRSQSTINRNSKTGEIEIEVIDLEVLSAAQPLPLNVSSVSDLSEDTRLRYRFLDLRRTEMHESIVLRSKIIASLRDKMQKMGFLEIQTPILTSSSPEGARDFLVPSRLHAGCFYALPQAPQQFKQLLMVAGFDKYFQVAPCFRDEDSRGDRSPGEFYQLDFEMSFVTQDDVFATIEPVLYEVFDEFSDGKKVSKYPFRRISYAQAMLNYGSDKPDLRNPLIIKDVTDIFRGGNFSAFASAIDAGAVVRSIAVENVETQPRSFFDKLNVWAKDNDMPGLGYITVADQTTVKGPIAKFLSEDEVAEMKKINDFQNKLGAIFFVCELPKIANTLAGSLRTKLGEELGLIVDSFEFCWIVDFPMYEYNQDKKQIEFSHNPFSMPQGGMEALLGQDPLDIKAYQYDIVCNGVELSSGAIRNHLPEVMIKAFEIAGYSEQEVREKFKGMFNAFCYGAPPHGGAAPGIDRIVMLLGKKENIREIIAFPLNQQARDLMMNAPCEVNQKQLDELHIKVIEQKQDILS